MRDDELKAFLRRVNPWWRAVATESDPVAWAEHDRTLRDRARHDLGYRADVLADIGNGPIADGLYVLRGPRRVGKSVALKDLIATLCKRDDLTPWHVIYLPADTFAARDLRRAVVLGSDLTQAAPDSRRVWIFDEITAVDGWTAEIKSLRDNSEFGEQTVVLTGSSAAGADQAQRDLGPGRTGSSRNPFRTLLPMTFRNFLSITHSTVPLPAQLSAWQLHSSEAAEAANHMAVFADDFDLAWQQYLETGGFPRAVAERYRTGAVSLNFLEDLAAWLSTDIDPAAPRESVALLLAELHAHGSSPLNVRNLAVQLGYSRDQLTLRLNRLISAYGAVWCPQIDDRGRRIPGSQSKCYLVDPLLAWIGHNVRPGLPAPDYSRLSEAALGIALARAIDEQSPGRWINADTIGYSRSGAGKEADFAPVPVSSSVGEEWTTPLESKWVSDGWRAEARVLAGMYGRGVVATKNIVDTSSSIWAMPAPIVALLLESSYDERTPSRL